MNDNKEIGLRIREMREIQKLSRENLAELANISTQFLADIETGKKGMTVNTLKKLCCALHISADYVVYGAEKNDAFEISPMLCGLNEETQKELAEIFRKIIRLL
ncbi:MAG: helix-turn-helix domain-containing protein [Clostridiales bacterium]|nr:helix-turn-helix domain-containing protein [Clostridiales bacterium]